MLARIFRHVTASDYVPAWAAIIAASLLVFAVLAITAVCVVCGGQDGDGQAPIRLYGPNVLGDYEHPISSANRGAQAYFNQGFRLMYAFARREAIQSFREAWRRDPDCAICYWGEAWARGSYLNSSMTLSDAPHAYVALQKALARRATASPKEQAYIGALSTRYVEEFDPDKRRRQDESYAHAMREVAEALPKDLDAMTLYGYALFLLEPREGERDLNHLNVQRLHKVLQSVLKRDPRHPGACHLYIHATESTEEPGLASACAKHLGSAMPGASHINHMPSHTWNGIGRWADSVRANVAARHSDLKAKSGEGVATYPAHNLHMLVFAASMDGRRTLAIQAGRDYAKLRDDTVFHALALIRFGKFDEVFAVRAPRENWETSRGLWDFAQGYAHLRAGDVDFAKHYLQRVSDSAETVTERFPVSSPVYSSGNQVLGTVAAILEGEIYRDADELDEAIGAFERAVKLEDALEYSEPEPLPFAARHWLGAALLEAKRPADAERVYLESLDDHPNNGWSLFGLRAALKAQGRDSRDVDAKFEESWARSDTRLRASRF